MLPWTALVLAVLLTGSVTAPQAQDAGPPPTLPPAAIDWKTLSRVYNPGIAAKTRATRSLRARTDQVDATTLPILLPDASTGVSRDSLAFTSLGDVYDINLPQPVKGLSVLLSGTRVFVAASPGMVKGVKFDQVDMGGQQVEVLFSQTEDGWTASFSRFGMAYTIDVICDEEPATGYCQDSSYIRKIAAGMTEVVLGARAEREWIAATGGNTTTPPRPTDTVKVPVNRDVLKQRPVASSNNPVKP
ncbi:hypothetical protein ABAC460_05025 [Asticcacaulis sp. AC460]|uniref:hypothetical protein n=1 Tax=Asticcacaulis sp. AC460 TaxID=1282360 RepID=UPI0003C4025A|nr:hypothetical protein [Asticcacaulis sp. AC460]ESQ91703.1 hypothetical protein ABAC460_05025 [Asticcacaulis sp. AC460]